MKNKLFWRFGFAYLVLLLLVLLAVDTYVAFSLRRAYLSTAFSQLESLSQLAQSRLPKRIVEAELQEWAVWMARAGIRVTLVARDGKVLADTDEDPHRMDNHGARPEIRAAIEQGSGSAVRHSATLGHDLLYFAVRREAGDGTPLILRFSLPLHRLDEALADFRRGLWVASSIILALSATASLLYFRTLSRRIERLKEFSRRVAAGDFRGLPRDRKGDELADLADAFNQTAARLDIAMQTLTGERNQTAAVLASMTEGLVVIGPDQRVIFCNAAFCRAVNVDSGGWKDRPAVEVIPHADLLEFLRQAHSRNAAVTGELVLGSVRTKSFAVTVTPVLSSGATAGSVMVLHDITELRRLEHARRDFTVNVSHEFKTPLTAIQGFAETLINGAWRDEADCLRFLNIIRENAVRLGRLTDDLLKLGQIEAGKLELRFQTIPIGELIGPCLEAIRLKAGQKNLLLETDCSGELPSVVGDVSSLQQILQNLLDNAVHYTPGGGRISIRAAVAGPEVVISVSDTGPGIPQTEQARIFERFYRADAGRSRLEGGTGLGLSIAKHLAEAHGGRIQVRSEVGQGATFSIHLPRK